MNFTRLFSWLSPKRLPKAPSEAKETDYGRRYGWLVEHAGEIIANLDYIRWDSDRQFWHEYKISIHNSNMSHLAEDPDAWIKLGVILRNIRFKDVTVSVFMMAPRGDSIVAIRGAYVPEERFREVQAEQDAAANP
jgi:hypothetical protein